MQYHRIVFMHDYEDKTVKSFLDDHIDDSDIIEYLKNWDMGGESEHNPYTEPPWGKLDHIYKKDNYVLSYNYSLGYVSLIRVED